MNKDYMNQETSQPRLDAIVMADAAVVHIPAKDLTYRQAIDFKTLFGHSEGRKKLVKWLINNDPLVHSAYKMASNEIGVEVNTSELHEAVVIVLANAFKNI